MLTGISKKSSNNYYYGFSFWGFSFFWFFENQGEVLSGLPS